MLRTGKHRISGLLITAMLLSLLAPLAVIAEKVEVVDHSPKSCCCSEAATTERCCDCIPLEDSDAGSGCTTGTDDFCQVAQTGGNAHLVLLLGYLPIDFSLSVENNYSINDLYQMEANASGFRNLLERPPQNISIV